MSQAKLILLLIFAACLVGCGTGSVTEPAGSGPTKTGAPVTATKPGGGGGAKSATAVSAQLGPGAADVENRVGSKAK